MVTICIHFIVNVLPINHTLVTVLLTNWVCADPLADPASLAASGLQGVACMRNSAAAVVPNPVEVCLQAFWPPQRGSATSA